MSRKRTLAGLALVAVAALAYHAWDDWRLSQPGFHDRSCWFSEEDGRTVRCGIFTVAENRRDPKSRTIRLPVVILKAAERHPVREPILYVTGGPGGQAYLYEKAHIADWRDDQAVFPPGHDLIVMGQRGIGLELPDFDCPELETMEVTFGARRKDAPPPDLRALALQGAADCAARLIDEGVDLTAYNSRESATDIAELRRALGIESWTLYGVSYGTRLTLSALRYHPEGIRSVILDSVFPPEASAVADSAVFFRQALQRLFAACAANEICTSQYGDLAARYEQARARLGKDPLIFPMHLIEWKSEKIIPVDDQLFDLLIYDALYSADDRNDVPQLLRATAVNVDNFLKERVGAALTYQSRYWGLESTAVRLSHICHDEAPFEDPVRLAAAIEEAGPLRHLITENWDVFLCEVWPAGAADAIEATPVRSEVPALLLAGGFDPVTPADLARSAARYLPNGHLFEFPDAGHGIFYEADCIGDLLAAFLAAPERRPQNTCHL